jgi:cytochrome P450
MAGRDTSASMMSNAWFELSKHSDVWNRLRKEVDTFNGLPPTYNQLQNMPYLRAVFNESMRLYPQVPENGRVALEDTVLPLGGGKDGKSPIFVPKGKVVMWSLYALHRRKDIFGDDADSFRPERWLDQDGKEGVKPDWGYLAFGGGPRVCMGRKFILLPFFILPHLQAHHSSERHYYLSSYFQLLSSYRAICPHPSFLHDYSPDTNFLVH